MKTATAKRVMLTLAVLSATVMYGPVISPVGVARALAGGTPSVSYVYTTFDAPFPSAANTDALAINNGGEVVGFFYPVTLGVATHGYTRTPSGSFAQIDVPLPGLVSTRALGVNDAGAIVGEYRDATNSRHGFVLNGSAFTTVDAPFPGTIHSRVRGLNNLGQIVGNYGATPGRIFTHSYIRNNGTFGDITFPGVSVGRTQATGINDKGVIVGSYFIGFAPPGPAHGFSLTNNVYRRIDFPGANQTFIAGVNNLGQVAGAYADSQNFIHGFILTDSTFTSVELPGVPQNTGGSNLLLIDDNPIIMGINNVGQITGIFLGSDGHYHGFLTMLSYFSSFTAGADVHIGAGALHVSGTFGLQTGSNGMDPATQFVTIRVGMFATVVPVGSFQRTGDGGWLFFGTVNGVGLNVKITPRPSPTFDINIQATGANLAGTTSPVTVSLTIGQNSGTVVARSHLQ